ncbi:zinc-ribbon domain-containing protein [Candidatus Collinsella stercoripullorum]|uniref:zinc-ribbon domain-containing protein n=1 Tax=Candidatus Collinsella stercoripullorum TaxID=2838522 RepID=UPI0022E2BB80|nr:zinc-ribbon domain-containing protein [Candidatus Collinsella stercoripullorum]
MFCRHCGKRLPDDSKFCTYCGKSVVIEDEGASAGQAPEPASTEAAPAPATAPVEAAPAPAAETAADVSTDDAPADDRGPVAGMPAADASEPSDDVPMADGTSPMPREPDHDEAGPDAPTGESAAPEPGTPHVGGTPAVDDALTGEVAAQETPDSPAASSADTAADAERPAAAADMPAAGATQPAAWTVPADAVPPPDASAPVTPPAAAGPSSRRRAPIVIAAVVAAVVVIAIVAGFAWQRAEAERAEAERAEQQAEREREVERVRQEALTSVHAVAIEVDARGWDTGDGASPLPVEVTGTEAAGDEVDEVQFVDSDGDGLELRAGDYELRVACSPIADDGTMYDAPSRAVELSIDEDLAAGRDLDRSDEVSFELDALRSGVSSADIERAYDYAVDAGCDDADDLRDAARERYLDADDGADDDVSASDRSDSSSGSSSSRGNAVSSMYDDEFLTMAVPDGWEINLASGGGDVFARYTVSLAGEQLFTIDVHTGSVSVTNTDITDPSGVVILGTTSDGMAVTATRGNGDAAYNNMANIANCLDTVRVK